MAAQCCIWAVATTSLAAARSRRPLRISNSSTPATARAPSPRVAMAVGRATPISSFTASMSFSTATTQQIEMTTW